MDFVAMSAAIDIALRVCELHGHTAVAETLRVNGPELFRLARIGQVANEERNREPEVPPRKLSPQTERIQGHG